MSDLEASRPSNWLSEALLIAAKPLIGYLFAFVLEAAFLRVFGAPSAFVSLSLTQVLIVAGAITSIAFVLFTLANSITIFVPGVPGPLQVKLKRLAFAALLFSVYFFVYGPLWREWIWVAVTLLVLGVLELGLPVAVYKGTLLERLAADEMAEDPFRDRALINRIQRRIGATSLTIALWFLFALAVTSAVGRGAALKQEEFLVVPTSPELVVLRVYGDYLVAARFDRATKSVERSFRILRPSDSDLLLKLELVGPLRSIGSGA